MGGIAPTKKPETAQERHIGPDPVGPNMMKIRSHQESQNLPSDCFYFPPSCSSQMIPPWASQ